MHTAVKAIECLGRRGSTKRRVELQAVMVIAEFLSSVPWGSRRPIVGGEHSESYLHEGDNADDHALPQIGCSTLS